VLLQLTGVEVESNMISASAGEADTAAGLNRASRETEVTLWALFQSPGHTALRHQPGVVLWGRDVEVQSPDSVGLCYSLTAGA